MTCRTALIFILLLPLTPAFAQQTLIAEGRTMGTTYRIIYFDEPQRRDFQASIDSLLLSVNRAISNYDPQSEVSRFNNARRCRKFETEHLRNVLMASQEIYRASGGAFDPTVKPLIDAWGFGAGKRQSLDNAVIDSLIALVGFDKVRLKKKKVCKCDARTQLETGGIGQGYGADVIFAFLQSKGIEHMLVELGGEGLSSGYNLDKNRPWTIGILHPNSTLENQFFKAYVTLEGGAYTTSGNYFNYRIVDGRKYGHTIDPVTGRSVQHNLLSVSVFAPTCTLADGWATALMVMGLERAKESVEAEPALEAVFMYTDEEGQVATYITPGIREKVVLEY